MSEKEKLESIFNKEIKVIDADAHIVEKLEHYQKYLDSKYKLPQVVEDVEFGTRYWVIDGMLVPRPLRAPGPGPVKGLIQHFDHPRFGKVIDMHNETPSARDGSLDDIEGRLRDMDRMGVYMQVVNPTLAIPIAMIKDANYAASLCRAYNQYVSDKLESIERIKANYVVPLQDVGLAIDELHRVVNYNGYAGIAIPPIVIGEGEVGNGIKTVADPSFDPFWKEVSKLNVPVTIHSLSSLPLPWILLGRKYLYSRVMTHSITMEILLTLLIGEGYFDRYPNIKVLLAEAGSTWLPYWIFYYSEQYEHPSIKIAKEYYGINELPKAQPLEYLKSGNIYVSVEAEEPTDILEYMIRKMGIGSQLVFATDYGHEEMVIGAVRNFIENQSELGKESLMNILSLNSKKFYNFNF
ncbi:amidohydrolase family protein [Metallosphaera javensis (ex Sakai et al. 2022)]|uniref:amidohydrolase family protein n=1 Tax=Metallosphaera javensis (ex Sakai et al. 2022) TaxID=2775498 RepID=UPI00258FB3CC|nr:MAG: amidohydrolase [Metallosphaera javensis (ex Sakai et al. 2022)]